MGTFVPFNDLARGTHEKERAMEGPHEAIGRELGALTDRKNSAYGASFITSADALKLLYPNGVRPEQYGNMLVLARIWDKLGRIATHEDAFGEEPWSDIAGYALLMVKRGRKMPAS